MNTEKLIMTIVGAAMAIAGLGGVPVYAIQQDFFRFGVFTFLLIAGIAILGYAAKD